MPTHRLRRPAPWRSASVTGGLWNDELHAHQATGRAFRRCRTREICAHLEVAGGRQGRSSRRNHEPWAGSGPRFFICPGLHTGQVNQPRATPPLPGRRRGSLHAQTTAQPREPAMTSTTLQQPKTAQDRSFDPARLPVPGIAPNRSGGVGESSRSVPALLVDRSRVQPGTNEKPWARSGPRLVVPAL